MCQKESWGNRCAKGSPFHAERPTTENARAWVVDVRAKGTKSNPCSDNRSELQPMVPGVGRQRSRRYAGARPRIHLQTMAPIRNMIRCWRGSQWSTSSISITTHNIVLYCMALLVHSSRAFYLPMFQNSLGKTVICFKPKTYLSFQSTCVS